MFVGIVLFQGAWAKLVCVSGMKLDVGGTLGKVACVAGMKHEVGGTWEKVDC
jgi:hypothetical protein